MLYSVREYSEILNETSLNPFFPNQSEYAHCLENKTVVAGVQRKSDKLHFVFQAGSQHQKSESAPGDC